jgi:hypothetical protein
VPLQSGMTKFCPKPSIQLIVLHRGHLQHSGRDRQPRCGETDPTWRLASHEEDKAALRKREGLPKRGAVIS